MDKDRVKELATAVNKMKSKGYKVSRKGVIIHGLISNRRKKVLEDIDKNLNNIK